MTTIVENKNFLIEKVENLVITSRPMFEVTIKGTKYRISAISYPDFTKPCFEDIQILNLETRKNETFADEKINRAIYSTLFDISSQLNFLTF